MRRGLAHTSPAAARAESTALATERDEVLIMARLTLRPQESVSQNPATQILVELFYDEIRQRIAGIAHKELWDISGRFYSSTWSYCDNSVGIKFVGPVR